MSDFAEAWMVWRASRAVLTAALREERRAAFLSRGARPHLVFVRDASTGVEGVSSRLPTSTIVTISAGDDWGEVCLVRAGRREARLKTTGRLRTRAHLGQATELLAAFEQQGSASLSPPALGDPVPAAIVAAMGVDYERLAFRSYDALYNDRFDDMPGRAPDLVYLDADGREEPFALAPRPVTAPRDATDLSLDLEAAPRELLGDLRRLDPANASSQARAALERLAKIGPRRTCSQDQQTTVREAAASLLSRCLASLAPTLRAREASRLADELVNAPDPTMRAALALALRRVGALVRPQLEASLDKERDPPAARRTYEALHDLSCELAERDLVERSFAPSARERKGAYALLEQSASPRTLSHLEVRLRDENDEGARALLAEVVERLRAELADAG